MDHVLADWDGVENGGGMGEVVGMPVWREEAMGAWGEGAYVGGESVRAFSGEIELFCV